MEEVIEKEFHENWRSRLTYNLQMLNKEDTLLEKKVLSLAAQRKAKAMLARLEQADFKTGLVHGDLCPCNTIWTGEQVYLLDWGTADVNVVAHNEIGIVLMSNQASAKEMSCFLEGLGISRTEYRSMEQEIAILNFLHWLDKYRWAEAYDMANIKAYEIKVRSTFDQLN